MSQTKHKIDYAKDPFVVVTPYDPAIDLEKSDVEKYAKTRDMSLLTFRPDMQPTRYYLKMLPKSLFLDLTSFWSATSANRAVVGSFCYCLVQVDNLRKPDGTVIQSWEPGQKEILRNKPYSYVSPEQIDEMFELADVLDIGAVAYDRHFLVRETPATFTVLPTSTRHIEAQRTSNVVETDG